jgi:glycosyltransferase involved in cell wall biosynthesis
LEEKIVSLGKNDQIFLDGFISEDEISQGYALKDLYIHNSFSEGHCISILQTMSCGLPILSTDVGGASETLT